MTKDEALKMAIEALEYFEIDYGACDLLLPSNFYKTLNACKDALEQPAQEPVAWMHRHDREITEFNDFQACQYCEPLYTHPAPSWQGNKEFVGLSDAEIIKRIPKNDCWNYEIGIDETVKFARDIEQELKTKNGFSALKEKNNAM
jgi:hypothetical protein